MAAAGERAGAALVIGVGEYLHAEQVWPLRYAAIDAGAMATLLITPRHADSLTNHAFEVSNGTVRVKFAPPLPNRRVR